MKFDHFVCCTFAGVFVILSFAQQHHCISHDSIIGYCSNISRNNSVPLQSKVIHKPNNKFMKFFRKTDVRIRSPEIGTFPLSISCIKMQDNAKDGSGGFAMIEQGGIGFPYVVIYFKSQTNRDIRFTVDIFGQPPYGMPASSYGTPTYPSIAAPPAGWIYPSNTYQQQPYVFNRN